MVYGAINNKGERFYTYMSRVFEAIDNKQKNYNWLITDYECYPKNQKIRDLLWKDEYCFISGEELTEIVSVEDFQWIWGVFSGFEKSVALDEILKFSLPYSDLYTGFWKNPLTMQHPLSCVEIVPWDGSLTLFLSSDKSLVDGFRNFFRYSMDLEEYNRS